MARAKRRGGRSSEAEILRRCADIYGLVVDGQPFRVIRQYVSETLPWGQVDDYTLRRYIARVTRSFAEGEVEKRKVAKAKAVGRLERLYARAAQKGHVRDALAVEETIIKLYGLNAAERLEITGAAGQPLMTVEELAALFEERVWQQHKRLRKDSKSRS